MVLINEITDSQLKIIEDFKNKNHSFFREQFNDILGPFKESPLKSFEQQERERNELVGKFTNFFESDLMRGLQLFLDSSTQEENLRLKDMIKLFSNQSFVILEGKGLKELCKEEDLDFLDTIANREFTNQRYEESSCMYRFIVRINFFYFPAWVGWADSEKKLCHFEIVETIYDMAMEFFPDNAYLVLFASDFYVYYNQKDKAISLLNKAKIKLINEGMVNTNSFQAIQNRLNKQY